MSRRRRGPRQAEPGRDEPAGFDQALGAKLGRAVTRTVDNATDGRLTKPAISLIVERAEAQSKARRARRAVGSLAAAVAIFAGGQAVWNALPRCGLAKSDGRRIGLGGWQRRLGRCGPLGAAHSEWPSIGLGGNSGASRGRMDSAANF